MHTAESVCVCAHMLTGTCAHTCTHSDNMAEYGWGITEPLANRARTELNEVPEERPSAIAAVRAQMETRPDIGKKVSKVICNDHMRA